MAYPPLPESWDLICAEVLRLLPEYQEVESPSSEGPVRVVTAATSDGLHTFRLGRDEFVFSRLAPYIGWESFRNEAKRIWEGILPFLGNPNVHTFGLRYINRIHFPVNTAIGNYLRLYPYVPPGSDGNLQNFFNIYLRVAFKIEHPQGFLTVQEVQLPPEDANKVTVALDNQFDFAGVGLTDALIWEQFEVARELKNRYFVEFLSPDFLETFR